MIDEGKIKMNNSKWLDQYGIQFFSEILMALRLIN